MSIFAWKYGFSLLFSSKVDSFPISYRQVIVYECNQGKSISKQVKFSIISLPSYKQKLKGELTFEKDPATEKYEFKINGEYTLTFNDKQLVLGTDKKFGKAGILENAFILKIK